MLQNLREQKTLEQRLVYDTPTLQDDTGKPLGFARYLAWVVLLMVVALTAVLSIYIGKAARSTLLQKQHNFAELLAENLNHQIYRRFTRPTLLAFPNKPIALMQPVQYNQLDNVVQSIIHGLNIHELRIYGRDHVISYSTNKEELGSAAIDPILLDKALLQNDPIFIVDSEMSYWQAFFSFPLEPKSFMLRTIYPLRIGGNEEDPEDGALMGILEFSQDISSDMESVFRFQQLVSIITLFSSLLLFMFLLFFIRRAEIALQALHNTEKLVAMGKVVASIAHEIRNPLGIICSSSELLLNRSSQMDKMSHKILQAIYDESKRLSVTVRDFLDFAKPHQPKREQIDLRMVLDKALAFLESEVSAKEIDMARAGLLDTPLNVTGDPELLYRAVYNVLSNAIQATANGGGITITQQIDNGNSKPWVQISIHDSGSGFTPAALRNMLVPFFTTKEEGTGLGLPIVQNIINGHGGKILFINAPEGGALVKIRLPYAGAPTEQSNKK